MGYQKKSFEKSKHIFKYDKEEKDQIVLIDNKQYWGTDGEMPKTEYESIKLVVGGKGIVLPKSAFANLYEPNLSMTQVHYDKTNSILYILSENSDAAGSYEVIWKVEKGIYKERFIAYGFQEFKNNLFTKSKFCSNSQFHSICW